MTLPGNFKWLESIGTLPKMVQEGFKLLGIHEIAGPQNNPEIIKLAAELGVSDIYTSDDRQAWCAVALCAVARRAGKQVTYKDRYDYLRALAFAKQGVQFNLDDWEEVDRKEAMLGDAMIYQRKGGGHNNLYIGENTTHFFGMGGNQDNMYSFTRVSKERLYAVRRPRYKVQPPSVRKYFLSDIGVPITTNEQ